MSAPRRYRTALTVALAIALLAATFVAVVRVRAERDSRRVEIAMDYPDFSSLARSYAYNEEQFLVALRRAGLTSLAVSEELGGNINAGTAALLVPGSQLIDQARLSNVSDPTLAGLVRGGKARPDELYLLVYDPREVARYRRALGLHLSAHAVRTLRTANPTVLAIRTQSDFFNNLGMGLPAEPMRIASHLKLLLVPRVQNDERFGKAEIDRFFGAFEEGEKPSTAIFFGTRNEVIGYPDHLDDTAAALKRTGINFGSIEVYDRNQVQKGNEGLAQRAIERTTRVQAISKLELDKLDFETVVARYLLGVRERNVRVVYLRPFLHARGDASLEKTNVEMISRIAGGLRARGYKLGRATPVPPFAINPIAIALVSLAVPAILLLLLEAFGIRRPRLVYALFAADLLLVALGYVSHHDLLARKAIALVGAIAFSTMGFVAIPRAFTLPEPSTYGGALVAGLRTLGVALAFALMGALIVVGLLSVPLLMEAIDTFTGVKLVIVVPPLLAFLLYVYTRRFGNVAPSPAASALEPVRIYQLITLTVLAIGAFLYVSRSGNQSDIAPSSFEIALRSNLTALLGVRPRFKEFAIGFPLLMLLPALRLEHRRLTGWLFAIAAAIGTADVIDTFSHLHTPLFVSFLRIVNGAVVGIVVGAVLIALYRAFVRTRSRA
ncbi:MAG: hypothetical protein GIW95_07145 [Candidatus Eremiobacteraeota bacterium]|nr:hypothetical protein [Candidatus Eremiobacteraeota bacterium]